jgi:hypothetical protein
MLIFFCIVPEMLHGSVPVSLKMRAFPENEMFHGKV